MSQRLRRILIALFVLGLLSVGAWVLSLRSGDTHSKAPQGNEAAEAPILPVNVTRVEAATGYALSTLLVGEVLPAREASLAFELSGKISSLNADVGDRLTPKQVVAELDQESWLIRQSLLLQTKKAADARLREMQQGPRVEVIRAAKASVAELAARRVQAERDNRRARDLVGRDSATQSEADAAASNLEAVSAQLEAAKARLAELEAGTRKEQIEAQTAQVKQVEAELAAVVLDLAKTKIRPSFPIVVMERLVDEGSVVARGQPLMRGIESGCREARIGVPAAMAGEFRVGQALMLTISGKDCAFKVKSLVPTVDSRTRTRQMILRIEGAVADSLPAGEIAELSAEKFVKKPGFWLPTTTLVRGARGLWGVFVAKSTEGGASNWVIERAYVHLLHTDGERAFVEGSLAVGMQVVTNGTHRVVPGQRVSIVEAGR